MDSDGGRLQFSTMSAAASIGQPYRFTVDDYYRMGESGILGPEDRVQLIDGKILRMSPIGRRHGGCVKRLVRHFKKLGDQVDLSIQDPLHVDDFNEPQPDFMLLKPREDVYSDAHPVPQDVLLLAQAADATLKVELAFSPAYYARHGVCEFWIIDVIGQTIHVFRQPRGEEYEIKLVLGADEKIAALAFPDHPAVVRDLTG